MPDTYCVYWVSNRAGRGEPSLRRSGPYGTPAEARREAKRLMDEGLATMAAIFTGGRLLSREVWPAAARKAVTHYLDMAAHAGKGPPPSAKGT